MNVLDVEKVRPPTSEEFLEVFNPINSDEIDLYELPNQKSENKNEKDLNQQKTEDNTRLDSCNTYTLQNAIPCFLKQVFNNIKKLIV